ncbi:Botcinic acid biosynthesis cluster B protein 16 [Colletotrichum aenigma]|uniref:Botcinic acid biosynthesis cluster B protein 16 n=1 Tax=Colletotrichum aenigma TaxID=1215731 RepID=UPI0018729B38|nr:Botcinic acid biosynthesis cluster B protein 16 [Colletotrichum aenigma]KAF5520359.1 Botcinic acid biosynthesis cluster B protein 16 [Colletotrichum aenigma]
MHLILTGATGLVGSSVLDAMLKSKDVTKISILSRRPVSMLGNNPKANVIIHKDFETFDPSVLAKVDDADGVVWALGISQTKVTKDEYVKITNDYPLAAAVAFSKIPSTDDKPFRFVYVSSGGATATPGLFTPYYGMVKGEAEVALAKLRTSKFNVESVRPVGVDPSNHEAIKPHIPDPGLTYHAMSAVLMPMMRSALLRRQHTPTEHFGPFLVDLACGKHDKQLDAGGDGITQVNGSRILDNWAFRRLHGLS